MFASEKMHSDVFLRLYALLVTIVHLLVYTGSMNKEPWACVQDSNHLHQTGNLQYWLCRRTGHH